MCSFLDTKMFLPENTNALRGYKTFVQNPTKSELLRGVYKPRLTITNRFNTFGRSEWTLSIELSLPKLLYRNNFDELSDNDFPEVIELLQSRLKEMGVKIFTAILEKAPVSSVHYSKNIPLTDGSTPHYYISKIKDANVPLLLDVNESSYQNDGCGFKWHANSYEVAFYDKIHDLGKAKISDKRAFENDNSLQLDLFEAFQERKQFEVLRMEVRLNNRQKTRKLFKTLGIRAELNFSEVFSTGISRKVLLYYIDEMAKRRPIIMDSSANPKDFLASLIVENPTLGLRKTFAICGLKQALEAMDIRELRGMFEKYGNRSWSKFISESNSIKIKRLNDPFAFIRSNIETFMPLKLVDFQGKMINNDKYD
jgi:hypothetical protein